MTITEETLKHVLDMGMYFTTEGATLSYLSNYGHTRAIIDLDANTFMITVGDSGTVIERGSFTNDDDPVELLSDIATATGNIDMAIESAEETIHPYQD